MATEDRAPGNAPGRYYVNHDCTCCSACTAVAPEHFAIPDGRGTAIVHRQPSTPADEALCEEARDACPVEAIREGGRDA